MSLFDRIANYFKEWDGIDETAPKMELSINDLRYIADMNIERRRLIRQLNEANLKTEEIRNKAIDEFLRKICEKYTEEERKGNYKQYCCNIKQELADIAEQMKGGVENGNK